MVIKEINIIVKQWLLLVFIIASCGLAQAAYATAWFDYGESAQPVGIESTDPTNATVIVKKSGTCPKNGYLLVTGSGQFHAYPSSADLTYGITRDTTAPYAIDSNSRFINLPDVEFEAQTSDLPIHTERVDSCQRGQTITYRLVGSATGGFGGNNAESSVSGLLVIQFFDVLI